ncbi:START-like domain [Plasmopara halstedii]|uniref:START-like domain n=1 Tax=Plasmopara halstedii TaxID=4781 RepID=A0A0P1AC32_PLAHL|nr:START-like domain [Plasmopara halstedii]CEG38162.1 START-like domain [Plasmopara halstedii]|eukprot:XP_024574531.1 START-like domain [Plasmopara halstedii]
MTEAVSRPPVSNGLVSTMTFDIEEDAVITSHQRQNDVTSTRLRLYHQECKTQLDTTLRLYQERQEYAHRSCLRQNRTLVPRSSDSYLNDDWTDTRVWKLIRESCDISVYRLKTRQERTSTVQAIGTIHGSLSDVMNGLYADSTKTARVLQMLLSPRSLDTRILQVDKRCTEINPFQFSGIIWMAIKLPGLGLCRHRDFVCFKKMDVIKDEMGQEFGYLILQSIDQVNDNINFNESNHYVRGFISLVIIFHQVGDDRVAMFGSGQFDPSGRLSPLVGDNCVAEWFISMANTVESGQAKNLSQLLVRSMHENEYVATSTSRSRCGICARTLFFWDVPRNCRGCWKVCCRTCRMTKPIFCAHSHTMNTPNFSSGPCTETFCLACVCAVIPSGATMNARLLQRLAKKRKRTPTTFRPPLTTCVNIEESNVKQHETQLIDVEVSSISILSSRESEKYQQHRLSLNARPKKRAFVQIHSLYQEEKSDETLEVLEHYQMQHQDTISEVSSSIFGTSLRSFTSADLGSIETTSLQLGRYPSGHSLVTHNQSFHHRVGLPMTSRQNPVDRSNSLKFQAQSSFWLPRQSTLIKRSMELTSQLGDDYYHRLLQNYLLRTYSSQSIASSYGCKSTSLAKVPEPPISNESNVVSESQASDTRDAVSFSFQQTTSELPPDVVIYRKFK